MRIRASRALRGERNEAPSINKMAEPSKAEMLPVAKWAMRIMAESALSPAITERRKSGIIATSFPY